MWYNEENKNRSVIAVLEKYLNKALKSAESAESVECGKEFTMKSLFSDEERAEIGSNINQLGIQFRKAISENEVKGVVFVGETSQHECLYRRKNTNE